MKPLKVAILWHMHQPDYRDPVSGRTLLPWTYLHAVKDYAEMLRTAEQVKGARMTFNLVPTMLEQLERYARGEAQDLWLESAARDPAHMSHEEREFILAQFFSVHSERHILPYPRYRELARRRDTLGSQAAQGFSDQDLRDLQVWFLLAWSGHHLRQEEQHVAYLHDKGEKFSETDKARLIALYDRVVAGVAERYRQLEAAGTIEISVTPYAHPILPLLCGTDTAARATPGIQLPATAFRHAEDGRLQVRLGLDFVSAQLGERARGMWPAEGAVSEEGLRIMREEGALWAASDEGILAKSLPGGLGDRRRLYRPYSFEGLPLLFRDRDLSDRIGFVYAHWDPQRAAADLLGQLRRIAEAVPGGVVPLILDGENCWERYQDNGHPFLSALYRGLLEDRALEMTTISEAIAASEPVAIERIAPGSWINSDFTIWIGHPEENTAWEWLERGRRDVFGKSTLRQAIAEAGGDIPETVMHLLRAEGSDWFWWFGDDHVSAQADIFDRLFRRHLEALYMEAGLAVPQHLHQAIKPPLKPGAVHEPTALFTPTIDGRITDYFEWLAAGFADLSAGGAMHAAHGEFEMLHYGYDEQNLYLRLDPKEELQGLIGPGGRLEVRLAAGAVFRATLHPGAASLPIFAEGSAGAVGEGRCACRRIVEAAIPLAILELQAGQSFTLSFHLVTDGSESARWPAEGPLKLVYRGSPLGIDDWYV
ncbi:glycoside hydrolase [Desulfuromonas versatilis]|uniref:Glycoside hydrolase n=1 Tax=Desulfuromonas versatilis TaxID=2802975 RepID=A0ABN6E287_9BACT|nr:glycoside hydrolase family 57 protein [Desulfuromonas versatilis]BCR06418.1 glycoside hydrolase [Desulfuromonas versatilis]